MGPLLVRPVSPSSTERSQPPGPKKRKAHPGAKMFQVCGIPVVYDGVAKDMGLI